MINMYHHPFSKDPFRTVRPENFAWNRPGTESGTGTGTGESLPMMPLMWDDSLCKCDLLAAHLHPLAKRIINEDVGWDGASCIVKPDRGSERHGDSALLMW